uniref:(northern house mosquito) hypothetical protein n=1 Tax=Culex pipiens TaxID=7175 RepID=A0A8D8LCN6_CULPI
MLPLTLVVHGQLPDDLGLALVGFDKLAAHLHQLGVRRVQLRLQLLDSGALLANFLRAEIGGNAMNDTADIVQMLHLLFQLIQRRIQLLADPGHESVQHDAANLGWSFRLGGDLGHRDDHGLRHRHHLAVGCRSTRLFDDRSLFNLLAAHPLTLVLLR